MAILGIDEVGRGPLAGPLVVGAVILPNYEIDADGKILFGPEWILGLKDSKKLSAKKRGVINEIILKEAVACGLGWVSASEIDEVGISQALVVATSRAVKSVQRLHEKFTEIVIDGKVNFLRDTALADFVTTMPKADDLVKEVSAASIIAKVARDAYMRDLDAKYPGYGFFNHVGYGTGKHIAAIRELGICPEHRKSFEPIKSMVGFNRGDIEVGASFVVGFGDDFGAGSIVSFGDDVGVSVGTVGVVKNTTSIGLKGEEVACKFLCDKGHKIVVRNFRTRVCEIDIVSLCDSKIYFTEVKTRRSKDFGGGFGAINTKKLEKMKFAVEVFLKARPEYRKYDPLLAVASVDGEFRLLDWMVVR